MTKTFTYKGHTYTITPIEGDDENYVVVKDNMQVRRTNAWWFYEECDFEPRQADIANLFNNNSNERVNKPITKH